MASNNDVGLNRVSTHIRDKLHGLPLAQPKKSIFKIHNQLRKVNEEAYEPQYVAIGPYHRNKDGRLHHMEEQKLHYLNQMLRRTGETSVDRYLQALKEIEVQVRQQYAETITLTQEEFLEMMLLDGCFIVEIFRKKESGDENDPLLSVDLIHASIKRDLELLENQLPFIVITTLYGLSKDNLSGQQKNLIDLAGLFFIDDDQLSQEIKYCKHLLDLLYQAWIPRSSQEPPETPGSSNIRTDPERQEPGSKGKQGWIRHFLCRAWMHKRLQIESRIIRTATEPKESEIKDKHGSIHHLLRWAWGHKRLQRESRNNRTDTEPEESESKVKQSWIGHLLRRPGRYKALQIESSNIRTATELEEFGIKVKPRESCEPRESRERRESQERHVFDIQFNNGTLEIPPIIIQDHTETILRNLIAYEQHCPGIKPKYVTNYVSVMDSLVNTSKDVALLRGKGVIDNWLGDDEMVSNMFNRMGNCVSSSDVGYYARIFKEVNEHCQKKRHRWMASLRRDYFNGPWALISFLAAGVLLLLTLTQTVYAGISYYKKD